MAEEPVSTTTAGGQAGLKTEAEWVRVTSEDGWTFIVPRRTAMLSEILKRSLTSGFAESEANTCNISHRSAVVEKILEYLTVKNAYAHAGPKDEVYDFTERIPPELALELLMTADYLEV